VDVYVRRSPNRSPLEILATLLAGIAIGFAVGYFTYGYFSADTATPTTNQVAVAPSEDATTAPPAEDPTQALTTAVDPHAEPTAPVAEPSVDLAAMEDVWPARHLFIAVDGQKLSNQTKELLAELKPGGIVLRAENIRMMNQMVDLVSEIKAAVGLGTTIDSLPIIAVSQEGGSINPLRLKEAPTAAKIGEMKDLAAAREAGVNVGKSANSRGVGVLFAPALDVYVKGGSKDLQARTLGEVPEEVAAIGLAYADGIVSAGVLPVVKHFPGMGSVKEDPSKTLPIVQEDQDILSHLLLPFSDAASHGVPGILVGHVAVPAIDNEIKPTPPASLSAKFLNGLLREKWGFTGVVLADDLSLAAVTKTKTVEQAAVEALSNGCDAVLMLDEDLDKIRSVCAAIEKAAAEGTIDRVKLSASKKRLDAWQVLLKTPKSGLDGQLPQFPQTPTPDTIVATTEPAPEADAPTAPATEIEYTVVSGDGLKKIATKHDVTVEQIKEWNALKSDNLQVGQKLIIKTSEAPEPATAPAEATPAEVSPAAPVETAVTEEAETTAPPSEEPSVQPPANTKQIEHVVKGGDFLSSIATKYKVTYQDLMQWNHLNDTKLNVGQVLIVHVPQDFQDSESATATPTDGTPAPPAEEEPQAEASAPVETSETATPPADTEVTYSVKRGDNLANIASKYGVTVQDLREWNGIEGNRIDVDQKLKIRPNKLPAE